MRDRLRDNPVRTAGGITGLVAGLLVALADWLVQLVPGWVPDDVTQAAGGLAVVVAVVVGEEIGRLVQRRFTEPKGALDEIIAAWHREVGEDADGGGTAYMRDRVGLGSHSAPDDDGLDDPVPLDDEG